MDRRDLLKAATLGALSLGGTGAASTAEAAPAPCPPALKWRRGIENQRIADLGDGRFLNPVLSGDRPDPAILKDGADYYMTFSSFDAYPGLVIWHSRDLVNWRPLGPALHRNIGSVWAPSLEKHQGRYFLYIPVKASPNDTFVSWADSITGPWSDPKSLGLHQHIDRLEKVERDDRLEDVELQLSGFRGHRDGEVVADDLEANLVHDFGNDRIHLPGHDARARLHRRQIDFVQAGARPAR